MLWKNGTEAEGTQFLEQSEIQMSRTQLGVFQEKGRRGREEFNHKEDIAKTLNLFVCSTNIH